jgi:hypothetical protein
MTSQKEFSSKHVRFQRAFETPLPVIKASFCTTTIGTNCARVGLLGDGLGGVPGGPRQHHAFPDDQRDPNTNGVRSVHLRKSTAPRNRPGGRRCTLLDTPKLSTPAPAGIPPTHRITQFPGPAASCSAWLLAVQL